jgi:uncharacterized protein (TIGR03437 family)
VPTPTITSLSPPSVTAGAAAFTLVVNGAGFVECPATPCIGIEWFRGSASQFGAIPGTANAAGTQLTVSIPASLISAPGILEIEVISWAGYSNGVAYTVTPQGGSVNPGGVVSASAFGEFTSAAPGTWIEIYGTSLAADTRGWTAADFTAINAPTSLDGTFVTIGGQQAFVDFISPGQVNALIPSNVPTGTQQLTVTSPAGTSAPYSLTLNALEPGLLAPANFNIGGTQYVVALFADNKYVLPTDAISGLISRPAKPGDIIVLYGVGFGPVTPDIPAGQLAQELNTLASDFHISIGGVECQVQYHGLAPNYTGLYQFNIVVPPSAVSGNQPLTFTVNGVAGTQTLYLAVQD